MKFIRIQESTRHASYATRDEIVREIDVRFNPLGYSNVEACLSQLESPENWRVDGKRVYMPFPAQNQLGPVTIHVEGRMDFPSDLVWKEPGHRCDSPECVEAAMKVALGIPQGTKL